MSGVRYALSAAAAPTEEDVVDEVRVPEAWIGRKVIVKVRGQHGRPYSIFGRLAATSEEGVQVTELGQTSHGSPCRTRSYPWDSVMDVEPLDDE
jgi:hypothetical protein